MARTRETCTIRLSGTDHFRKWLHDAMTDQLRGVAFTVVEGKAIHHVGVECNGFSQQEDDDLDDDAQERIAAVVDVEIEGYPGDEGKDRWGEYPEPSDADLDRARERTYDMNAREQQIREAGGK